MQLSQAKIGQPMIFVARIKNERDNVLLQQSDVVSIEYTAYLLSSLSGFRKERIPGHQGIVVPISSTIYDECQTNVHLWTLDQIGYNFCHSPDISIFSLFPQYGRYEVCYSISLNSANPIQLHFLVDVE
ncbi:MAG: hypothetical protein Q4C95_01815 [Planctomycetia bacterium]|nr:hypothetical protein [Planctomycetia bacterium]